MHPRGNAVRSLLCTAVWLAVVSVAGGAAEAPCPLTPRPKVYRDQGRTWTLADAGQAAIVLGRKASAPERYAAERLQGLIERRYRQKIPLAVEDNLPAACTQLILLGQRSTHARLDRLCRERKIDLSDTSPGVDGFVIECLEEQGQQVVLLGACNPRAAIYAQDTLFDLLRRDGSGVVIPVVALRDWASIAWRGRPHSVLHQHLAPGAMDAYARARINFIDVRDDPRVKPTLYLPARKASMGFPAGVPIDKPAVKRVIDEAHRRGLFVYGTVSCGVEAARFPAVIQTYEELLALGVDGLWISFDDTGAGGDASEIIRRVLALGQRHEMTGRKIAITPPDRDYQVIDRPFNRTAAAIPGMEQIQWFFTRVPCQADVVMTRQLGIQRLPGWWHNLVDFGMDGGFLHNGDILCTLRADNRPAYVNIQPLSKGWHKPTYAQLRDAPQHTDTVLLWGVVNGWPEEYQVAALGLWAWEPQRHDWEALRSSVYAYVYGPGQVALVRQFDDQLTALKALFHLPLWRFEPNKGWPCRLKRVADRPDALARIDALTGIARRIRQQAAAETGIDPARLEYTYLEPIDATLKYARKMALLDYPEQWLDSFEDDMYQRVSAADWRGAEQALGQVRDKVRTQLDRIEAELQGLKGIREYVAYWRARVDSLDAWKRLDVQRRAGMHARLKKLLSSDPATLFPYKPQATTADLGALFAALDRPPPGAPLGELDAKDWLAHAPRFRGLYAVGPYARDERTFVAIGYPGNQPSQPGEYGEVAAEVLVPAFRQRLMLDVFINDTRRDNRWRNYRFMQLWVGDKLVWEEDVAADRAGREWLSVDVSAWAKPRQTLPLRFRVVEKTAVGAHLSISFLGPARLREQE